MDIEALKSICEERFEALLGVVTEAAAQLFRKDVAVEMAISEEADLSSLITGEEFPRVHLRFETSATSPGGGAPGEIHRHLITLSPELALNLYAWMIDSEPDDAISDAHLEGLTEGTNQILGQIQSSLDEESSFDVEGLTVSLIESSEGLDPALQEGEGVGLTYSVTHEEDSYSIAHFVWPLGAGEEATETEAELEVEMVAEPGEESVVGIHPVEFDSFSTDGGGNGQAKSIEMLMDVELEVLVELGKKPMLIRDILKLGKGSVVELDKSAGDPLDIFVNQKKLAEGEVVVVDDHFGIRITQLLNQKERIKTLG